MIDATTGLIIERDNGEGTADKACPEGKPAPDCFNVPAKFKRVHKIEMTDANAGGLPRKIGYIDLMDIADPRSSPSRAARTASSPSRSSPSRTSMSSTHADHRRQRQQLPLLGRPRAQKQDDNEFILLDVADFLKAK